MLLLLPWSVDIVISYGGNCLFPCLLPLGAELTQFGDPVPNKDLVQGKCSVRMVLVVQGVRKLDSTWSHHVRSEQATCPLWA